MKYGILTFDDPVPDISRKILHVDMDAFYASIEVRDNPQLKNKPVIIAKHPNLTNGRGIVSTCNYIARQYGVHSAMSAMEAYERCPQGIFIPGDLSYYRQVSEQIHQIFHQYTDIIEGISLDEAYLDITHNKKNIPSGTIIAQMIQRQIFKELHLTCSVGISYNKYIAKIASDFNKPNGITVVEPNEAINFLRQLPIESFPGVGKRSVEQFKSLNIVTGEDLYHYSLDELITHFGKLGYVLYYRVRGVSNSQVTSDRVRKSIGKERTFSPFLQTTEEVHTQIEYLLDLIEDRHNIYQLNTHTLTLKIRYEDFETITRQVQLPSAFSSRNQARDIAIQLWEENGDLSRMVRLLGVTFSNFNRALYSNIELIN